MVAHTNADTATTESTTPRGSNRDASGFRDSGTAHHARPTTTTTKGTFTRNTEPHQNCESNSATQHRAEREPQPATADHTPNARARSFGSVNTFVRTAIEVGMISAAPNPMIPRQTISAVALEENAATADAIPNTTRPICSTMRAAEAITQAATHEQEAREHEDVGVDDPLQLRGGRVEVAHERRQRDVQDQGVDRGDQHAEAHDDECPVPTIPHARVT